MGQGLGSFQKGRISWIDRRRVNVHKPRVKPVAEGAVPCNAQRLDIPGVGKCQLRLALGLAVLHRECPNTKRPRSIAYEKNALAIRRPTGGEVIGRMRSQRDIPASVD